MVGLDVAEAGNRAASVLLELTTDIKFWLALVAICVVWILASMFMKPKKNLPPGPPVWPILGSLLYLEGELHQVLWKLSKKFGDVMKVGLGHYTLIVVSSAEVAEELMKKRDIEFPHRSGRTIQRSAAKYIGIDSMDIAFSEYNPHLRTLRKVCTTELFTLSRLYASAKVRTEEISVLLSSVRSYGQKGQPMEVREYLHSLTMNIMCLMMFGKRYYGADVPVTAELENFKSLVIDVFDNVGRLNLSDLVWCLRWLDLQGINAKWKQIRSRSEALFGLIIEEHRQRRIPGAPSVKDDSEDFVDVLLSLQGTDKLSDKAMIGLLNDMILGGTDTTATTLEWCLVECVRRPELQQKLQEEIDRVVGTDRVVEEADLANLPYLTAFVKEVFRFHTSVPITLPRLNDNASSLGGFHVPAESTIFVNTYAIAHDPRYWEKPMEFNPDRFLGTNIQMTGNDFQLIPFGSGRRKCVGITLGITMVQRTLAAMVHAFSYRPMDGLKAEDVDVSESYLLVLRNKVSLKVVPSPRLPAEVYSPPSRT